MAGAPLVQLISTLVAACAVCVSAHEPRGNVPNAKAKGQDTGGAFFFVNEFITQQCDGIVCYAGNYTNAERCCHKVCC